MNKKIFYFLIAIISLFFLNFFFYLFKIRNLEPKKKEEGYQSKKKLFGFLIMATGKYYDFIEDNYKSYEKYLFKDTKKYDYRVIYFTDRTENLKLYPKSLFIYQKKLEWPYASMSRNEVILKNFKLLEKFDYLFLIDVDLLWSKETSPQELIGKTVACYHTGYYNRIGPFESRKISTAYIEYEKRKKCIYKWGGFFGAEPLELKKVLYKTLQYTREDTSNGVTAIWHDESYMNKYWCENPPERILDYHFIYQECIKFQCGEANYVNEKTRLIHVHKDSFLLRNLEHYE